MGKHLQNLVVATYYFPFPRLWSRARSSLKCRKCQNNSPYEASRENGLRKTQVFVTAKDTGAVQTYVVQFQEESPQIERLELRLPEGQELKEDSNGTT